MIMQLKTVTARASCDCDPKFWIRQESCSYPLAPIILSTTRSSQLGLGPPPNKALPSIHITVLISFHGLLCSPLPLLLPPRLPLSFISFVLLPPIHQPLFCFCHSMSQSSPFFSIARAHAGAGGRAAAAALLLRHPVVQLPPSIHSPRCFPSVRVTHAKTLRSHLSLPHATLSSFADADDDSATKAGDAEARKEQNKESEMSEMAKAFHISPRMAMSISMMIAFAALTVPLAMRSLVCHGTFKMSVLAYLTLLSGFYMAWNIGANDVANAMGTSVGSGALTLRQAVLTAALLEFSGAFLMGTHVTSTMQKGILVASVFQGKDSLLFAGLLSSLAAAGTWLQVCSVNLLSFELLYSKSIRLSSLLTAI